MWNSYWLPGSTDAFRSRLSNIDQAYVDGISITHGSPRNHIWTYAAASSSNESDCPSRACPCSSSDSAPQWHRQGGAHGFISTQSTHQCTHACITVVSPHCSTAASVYLAHVAVNQCALNYYTTANRSKCASSYSHVATCTVYCSYMLLY